MMGNEHTVETAELLKHMLNSKTFLQNTLERVAKVGIG